MPAFTPNRNYPYSINSDPADIPEAIQVLAEAIDVDMENLDDAIQQRPFAKASSHTVTAQQFPSGITTPLTYDFVDADTAGLADLVAAPDRMTVTSTGLWACWGSIVLPNFTFSSKNLDVRLNGVTVERNALYFEITGRLTAISVVSLNHAVAGDYFQVAFLPGSTTANVNVTSKQMAIFRLTNT